jgi:hypothetical protein
MGQQENVLTKQVPICPKCGQHAEERDTQYGIRSSCCGLWSWNREPLADAATHELRRQLAPLLKDLCKTVGVVTVMSRLSKATNIRDANRLRISQMNEVTARKALAATEDILMGVMAGEITPDKGKKK